MAKTKSKATASDWQMELLILNTIDLIERIERVKLLIRTMAEDRGVAVPRALY